MNFKHTQGWMILILLLSSFMALAGTPYEPEFSIYNESEEGASKFRTELEKFEYNISRLLISPIILEVDESIDAMIIIGSERLYTKSEIDAYENFVKGGGVLVIFEDFGPAKNIAERMGISFLPGVLRETHPDLQINRPTQLFVRDLIVSQLFEDFIFPPLLVSEAVALMDFTGMFTGETLPLLMTFPTAFLDTNDNNIMELTDVYSPVGLPIGLMKLVGNGTLLVLGDSSLPLNRNWQRQVTLAGQDYIVTNAIWILLVLTSIMNSYRVGHIVFDESHLAIQPGSAAGLLNLIAGTWVGIVNTLEVTFMVTVITVAFTSSRVKNKIKGKIRFKRSRDVNITPQTQSGVVSNPTYAERGIIQQYILYNVMEDNFIHVANSNLIEKLKLSGRAEEFLEELRAKYGVETLSDPMTFDKLLELHNLLRQFVDENSSKWLR